MKINEGTTDRAVRIVTGIILLAVGFIVLGSLKDLAIILFIVSFMALLTGITGHCTLYSVLGISTCPKCNDKS
ncbi:DUF2892 domain-containing protein [Candidatus Acidulodesulfobacterium sp. H_13]|uniref:YgaP family membrane protein n=1 Tax=Candidatus Acidulodesulfobacterium sp. H_13 TaxID=3395470 RepID=UPI003AF6A454